MTEAMPFLQKYDITFLRPPTIARAFCISQETPPGLAGESKKAFAASFERSGMVFNTKKVST